MRWIGLIVLAGLIGCGAPQPAAQPAASQPAASQPAASQPMPKSGDPTADSKARWNRMYSTDEFLFGVQPNAFFAKHLKTQPPGRVLLPAEGEGRNAVWAAKAGWQVDAFDISEVARTKALGLAAKRGVSINYRVASFDAPGLKPGVYDAAALIYAHVPSTMRAPGIRHIQTAIRPGGRVIIEAFSPAHLALKSAFGPKSVDALYTADELRSLFDGWQIEHLDEARIELEEGRHAGPGVVVRMVARKPG